MRSPALTSFRTFFDNLSVARGFAIGDKTTMVSSWPSSIETSILSRANNSEYGPGQNFNMVISISAQLSWIIAVSLAILHWILAVWSSRSNSTTFDEVAHIAGGMGQVLFGDYRLNPENGVLPQMIAASALVAGGIKFPDVSDLHSHEGASWLHSDAWELGYRTLYQVRKAGVAT